MTQMVAGIHRLISHAISTWLADREAEKPVVLLGEQVYPSSTQSTYEFEVVSQKKVEIEIFNFPELSRAKIKTREVVSATLKYHGAIKFFAPTKGGFVHTIHPGSKVEVLVDLSQIVTEDIYKDILPDRFVLCWVDNKTTIYSTLKQL